MVLARRWAVVAAVTLWLGGLTFYAGFVIRIAHRVLGGSHDFGFVTAEVTGVLHWMGVVAVVLLLVNLLIDRASAGRLLVWGLAVTWFVLAAALVTLFLAHASLREVLLPTTRTVTDRWRFRPLHEFYQLTLGVQWVAGALHLGFVLAAWRRADRSTPGRRESLPTAP